MLTLPAAAIGLVKTAEFIGLPLTYLDDLEVGAQAMVGNQRMIVGGYCLLSNGTLSITLHAEPIYPIVYGDNSTC